MELDGIVKVEAEWCGPCREMRPLFEDVADEFDDIDVTVIDVDEDPGVAKELDVKTVPAFFAMDQGTVVETRVGTQNRVELRELFEQVS